MTTALVIIAALGWALALVEWIRANAEQDRADTPCAECAAWRALRVAEAKVREAGRRAEGLRQR